jgi:hypothetical protein
LIFAIVNTKEFPLLRNHYFHVKKFADGFAQNGFSIVEISKLNDLNNLNSSNFYYISNQFHSDHFRKPLRKFLINKLKKCVSNCKATPILWGFHDTPELCFIVAERKHIFLTEDFSPEWVENHEPKLRFYNDKIHHKLQYSSNLDDRLDFDLSPFAKAKPKFDYDFNFIGSRYKVDLLKRLRNTNKVKCHIHFYPPVQNEIKRLNSFSSSKINLVYHSKLNILKGFHTERFPEALSMGNIIVHDHPKIDSKFRSKGVIFETEYYKIIKTLKSFKNDDINDIKKENYITWQKSELSYRKQVKILLDKI